MIELLEKFLLNKYEYTLDEYAVFETERERSKLILPAFIVFGIFVILFFLGRANVTPDWISTPILVFAFIVFVLLPLAMKKGSKYDAIIVTPELLIQRVSKSEFVAINYDDVTKFKLNDYGILIKDRSNTITLSLEIFRAEIEPVIDILEAKGKTFDESKEYMIRPIKVHIKDNKITIEDIEEEVIVDEMFEKYCGEFPMLTPGFLNEIIFRNSVVDCSTMDEKNLVLGLDSFEVKGGHPENTTFGSIDAQDCIVIFEDVKVKNVLLQEQNKKDEPDKKLELSIKSIHDNIEKSVISSWKVKGNHLDMVFQSGVHSLRTSFDFKKVILGWKSVKEEKK